MSYTVEVDGDADFIGAKVYTTKTTSLVVPDPLVADDYYWRVTAAKAAGIVSVPSVASRFVIMPLAAPALIYPPNDVNLAVEDVVLDWAPVAGRQVLRPPGGHRLRLQQHRPRVQNIQSTRYSPPAYADNNQYWWRVRAVDLAGQARPWTESQLRLQARVAGQARRVFPAGLGRYPAGV